MAGQNTAAFAIFSNRPTVEAAIEQLTASGFSTQDISVLMASNTGTRDFATEKNTKAPEGAATGVTVGGAIGGTLGLLASIGALAIPGVGPLLAAGPLVASLAGLGVGGAIGGLIGTLTGLGIPEYEARRYEGRVANGGILLSVHCDTSEEVSNAVNILNYAGGQDVASTSERSTNKERTINNTAAANDLVGASTNQSTNPRDVLVEETDRIPTATGASSSTRHTY